MINCSDFGAHFPHVACRSFSYFELFSCYLFDMKRVVVRLVACQQVVPDESCLITVKVVPQERAKNTKVEVVEVA